jgi:hypothetical protein
LLNNMGRLHERDGNYDKAIHFFEEAVRYSKFDSFNLFNS